MSSFVADKIVMDGLTYDDVLLIPAYSEVLPKEVELKTKFSRNIELNVPFVTAAMDTKLNIDYFIEEVIDDEHVDDIYDYFMESDTDDLDTAQNELGEDYSEDEIRLVRIKFLSEQAN